MEEIRVLLVEDDPADAKLFMKAVPVLKAGPAFRVERVSSMSRACASADANRPDVLVADLFLPDSEGLETVGRIADRYPDLPLVVLTGDSAEGVGLSALQHGAQDFLVKGAYDDEVLARALRYSIERKRADKAVLERRGLEERHRIQADFIATISHELRTPIAAVQGFAETLRRGALDDNKNRLEFVQMIEKHAGHLAKLVDDLLTIAAMEHTQERLEREPIRLGRFVCDVWTGIEPLARKRRVRMRSEIPEDLTLSVDRAILTRIFENLISNGIKFSRDRGGLIEVEAKPAGSHAAIRVSDNGIGMGKDDLTNVFRTFHRSERVRRAGIPGTGLGLSIVKAAVEMHGGQIAVEGQVGRGTRVDFTLPMVGGGL